MVKKTAGKDEIIDVALEIAQFGSWDSLRLHEVAQRLGMSLEQLGQHFHEKEEIAEAWFDRADRAMLAELDAADFMQVSARDRIKRLIMAWLGALAPRRRVTRQMICSRLEPGQIHLQLAGLTRVRRTVQWMREGAQLDANFPWRALEEAGLTWLYLTAFCHWMGDDSEGSDRTAAYLDRSLGCMQQLNERMPSVLRSLWAESGSASHMSAKAAQ